MMTSEIKQRNPKRVGRPPRLRREILDEEAFRRMLCLERRRTERSPRLFVLMVLDVARIAVADRSGKSLARVLESLSASVRETDTIGWNKTGSQLGILFLETPAELRRTICGILHARISGVLYQALSFDHFSGISIWQHVCPEQWQHDTPLRPSHPVLYPDLAEGPASRRLYAWGKRLMDTVVSLVALLLLSPLLLAVALAVQLTSPGPVLFRQVRVGQYGTPFVFFKFRSMVDGNNAEVHRRYVQALIAGRPDTAGESANHRSAVFKLTRDPRVTRVGAFLRQTSLDELPQLFNVLRGEMSLVGPRPAIPYEVEAYQHWHRRRVLEAKPGITGLWQVKGRSRVTFDEMVRLDVQYALARSLWLDVKILAQTPGAVLLGTGAY